MGATVVDYASLGQAIQDFTHRASISTYTDYFIQLAQNRINTDIFAQNTGEGVRYMEASYPATAIVSGTCPVPTDWLAPKAFQIQDGQGDTCALDFKSPEFIYAAYPTQNATGLPVYIARDVQSGGQSFPTNAQYLTATVTGTTMSLSTGPAGLPVMFVAVNGVIYTPGVDYSISGTTLTFTNSLSGANVYVQFFTAAAPTGSSTWVFIFGPYPDASYTVQGSYYQKAPVLSGSHTTNWMVTYAPDVLLAACMVVASRFLKDAEQVEVWEQMYQSALSQLIMQDKAERWAGGTLMSEPDTPSPW